MRCYEEIKEESLKNFATAGPNYPHGMALLEVLLDIRELLLEKRGNPFGDPGGDPEEGVAGCGGEDYRTSKAWGSDPQVFPAKT